MYLFVTCLLNFTCKKDGGLSTTVPGHKPTKTRLFFRFQFDTELLIIRCTLGSYKTHDGKSDGQNTDNRQGDYRLFFNINKFFFHNNPLCVIYRI